MKEREERRGCGRQSPVREFSLSSYWNLEPKISASIDWLIEAWSFTYIVGLTGQPYRLRGAVAVRPIICLCLAASLPLGFKDTREYGRDCTFIFTTWDM